MALMGPFVGTSSHEASVIPVHEDLAEKDAIDIFHGVVILFSVDVKLFQFCWSGIIVEMVDIERVTDIFPLSLVHRDD